MFKKKFCIACKKSFRLKKMWGYHAYENMMYVCSSCAPTIEEANEWFKASMEKLNNSIIQNFTNQWKEKQKPQKVDEFKW